MPSPLGRREANQTNSVALSEAHIFFFSLLIINSSFRFVWSFLGLVYFYVCFLSSSKFSLDFRDYSVNL